MRPLLLGWSQNRYAGNMIYDLCIGIFSYVGISLFFEEPFRLSYLFLALLFSLLPDIDFVPYVLLRKQRNLATHWFVHFPFLYMLLGGICSLFSVYLGVLLLVCTLLHLTHDLFSEKSENYPQELKLFYPFSRKSLSWQDRKFVVLDETQQRSQLELRRRSWQVIGHRSIRWEVKIRMEKISALSMTLFFFAGGILAWFIASRWR